MLCKSRIMIKANILELQKSGTTLYGGKEILNMVTLSCHLVVVFILGILIAAVRKTLG